MSLHENLYKIKQISPEGDTITALAELLPESKVFAGHFPGQPVVPGVALIDMAMYVIARALSAPVEIVTLKNAKFLSVLSPEISNEVSVEVTVKGEVDKDRDIATSVTVKNTDTVFAKFSLVIRLK